MKEECPTGILFLLDGIVKISQRVIRLFARQDLRFGGFDVLDTLVTLRMRRDATGQSENTVRYFEMEFHPDEFVLLVDHFEGVRAIAVHETKAIGDTTIGIENEKLKERYRSRVTYVDLLDALLEGSSRRSPRPCSGLLNACGDYVFESE